MKTLLFTNGKTMLKTIMKTSIHLPMAAMFLAAVLAGPAAARNQVPFKGQSSGIATTESFDPVAGIAYSRVEGEGQATHLGHFMVTGDVAVDVATGVPQGTWTLTAANGDTLTASFTGQSQIAAPLVTIVETATVTGGTGPYRSASN